MHVLEKYYDEIFDFKGKWDMPSRCGLRILQKEKTIIIVTELYQDNPGTSITAAGRLLTRQICDKKNIDINGIMYIQCNPDTNSKLSFYEEEFFAVDFTVDEKPVYRQLSENEKRLFAFP